MQVSTSRNSHPHRQWLVNTGGPQCSEGSLTEDGVAKLKAPAEGHIDYFDTLLPGLILRVGYGGSKTWLVRYIKRRNGDGKKVSIPTTHKLGRYPVLKVKEARDKARLFLADPVKAKTQADIGSFRDVAENFIKRHVEHNGLRTRREIENTLKRYVYPHWADRPFRDLKRGDVADLLDKIVDKHSPRQADKSLAVIRKMMNWYTTRNGDYVSVIVRGMNRYKPAEHKRKRTLDDDEIGHLWTACADMGVYGALLKVLLLTGQRKDKVAHLRWDDLHGRVWTIRSEKREKPNAGELRLPPVVLDIINAQQRIAGNSYVFAGRNSGPYNAWGPDKRDLDTKLVIPHWVNHDLRRTAKTLMVRAGVRPDISERVLGHTILGVEGTYDQHDYIDEKADALIKLAARVELIHQSSIRQREGLGRSSGGKNVTRSCVSADTEERPPDVQNWSLIMERPRMSFSAGRPSPSNPHPIKPAAAIGAGGLKCRTTLNRPRQHHPRLRMRRELHRLQDEMTPTAIARELEQVRFADEHCLLSVDMGVRDFLVGLLRRR